MWCGRARALTHARRPCTTLPAQVVTVKEKQRLWGSTQVMREFRTGENKLQLAGGLRNAFGRGERVEVSSSFGDSDSRSHSVSFLKPRFWGTRGRLHLSGFRVVNSYALQSSFQEVSRGASVAVSDEKGVHTAGYEAAWRDVAPVARSPPDAMTALLHLDTGEVPASGPAATPSHFVLQQGLSPSLKSALNYTYQLDGRDSPAVPSRGYFFRARSELAGVGGDARHVKLESDAKYYVPLAPAFTLGLALKAGMVRPWDLAGGALRVGGPRPPCITDRLFLGGPMSLRGFGTFGVGPREDGDATGACAMAVHSE